MAPPTYIAGHTFVETPTGRRCSHCNVKWVNIRNCTEADIDGADGLAHQGKLTAMELKSIRDEVKREDDAIRVATIDAASAGSR